MKNSLPKTECLGMIKRLTASALVVLTAVSCQQMQKSEESSEEVVNAAEAEMDYTPRVIDVNTIKFVPPGKQRTHAWCRLAQKQSYH